MYAEKLKLVVQYIEQGDQSLALRRLLDLVYETGDSDYMQEANVLCDRLRAAGSPEACKQLITHFIPHLEADLNAKTLNTEEVPLLAISHLQKHYRRSSFSLWDINFTANACDVIGVVGENGNGKTTLLECIAGNSSIDSGHIMYRYLINASPEKIKATVAFIPQRIPKWYGPLKQNLHFSAAASGLFGRVNDICVNFMVNRLELNKFINHSWHELSSGYRTRFEIARTLLTRPSILVLDEPLANLDINAQQTLLGDLKSMGESIAFPMAILLSSQHLFEVEKIASKIVLLKQGRQINMEEKQNNNMLCVLEMETTTSKEDLQQIFAAHQVTISYNGNYYTLESQDLELNGLLQMCLANGVILKYYRDITHSTKRFF
jgi:ABC-2 type transport system ATP-binding protein